MQRSVSNQAGAGRRGGLTGVLLALLSAGCAHLPGLPPVSKVTAPPQRETAERPLPYCRAEMDDPGYWLRKMPAPDRVLMTPGQISEFNRSVLRCGWVTDVFSPRIWDFIPMEPDVPDEEMNPQAGAATLGARCRRTGVVEGYTLFVYLKEETERIKRRPRRNASGQVVSGEYYRPLDENLNLYGIREHNPVRYGLTFRRTDIRYYPTQEPLHSKESEPEFDVLQVSALQAAQPVAILHASRDNRWLFVISPYCQGWIRRDDVVSGLTPEEIKRYLNPARRLVVTGHAVDAAWQPGDTGTAVRLYMGTSLPLLAADGQYYQVGLPDLDGNSRLALRAAYLPKSAEAQEGYLPFTSRNILTQAFRLLNTPYSWGGREEYRDCSQLVMDVYATLGLVLPRNSASQGEAGGRVFRLVRRQPAAQRQAVLNRMATPALLAFPGHIMIYLGRENGRYYAIHDIWSFRKTSPFAEERQIIIGQVVVSDLSLGEDSRRGSLLERLTTINPLRQ